MGLLNFSVLEELRDQLDVAKKYVLSAFDLIDATSRKAKREWTTSLEFFQGPAPEIDAIRKAVAEIS